MQVQDQSAVGPLSQAGCLDDMMALPCLQPLSRRGIFTKPPNPSIEGMPKRLRLLCTPHVTRWANARSGPHAQAVSLSRRSRFARLVRRQVRAGLLALPLAAPGLYAALYARTHSPLGFCTAFCLPPSSRPTLSVGQGRRGKFLLPHFTT